MPRITRILLLVAASAMTAFLSGVIYAQSSAERNQRRPRTVSTKQPSPPSESVKGEPEPEVIRVETNLVNTVFTAVDRDRHFITTLKADDLRIYENDTPQAISLFERETDRPLTLVILVDTSKSQERTLPDEKKAAKAFIRSVVRPEKDKVAVVSFTGVPRIEQQLTENVLRLNRAIDVLRVELPANNPNCDEERPVQEDPLLDKHLGLGLESASEVLGKAVKTRAGQ